MSKRIGFLRCDRCGSDRIQTEAVAVWSLARQKWTFDHQDGSEDYCNDCRDTASTSFVLLDQWFLFGEEFA